MEVMMKIRKAIDTINEYVGMVAKFSLVIIGVALSYEVVSRYGFNNPTIWAQDVSKQALAIVGALGGSYAYLYNQHVRVDVLYGAWSDRKKAVVDMFTSVLFLVFVGLMVVMSIEMAKDSWFFKERATTVFAPPLYYIKTLIPIGAILMFLQGISKLLHDIMTIKTGKSEGLRHLDF